MAHRLRRSRSSRPASAAQTTATSNLSAQINASTQAGKAVEGNVVDKICMINSDRIK